LLSKYGKLLLGAYILRRLHSSNSHEVSEHRSSGMLGKYGKLILGAYLVKRFRAGKRHGTAEHEESTEGLLHRYGKLMLTTYAMKRLRSRKSHKEMEQPQEYVEPPTRHGSFLPHMAMKYGKWLLGAYLMRRFHHRGPEAEITEVVETETYEEDKGSSMFKFNTIMVGALAGVTAVYAIKKYRAKHCGYKIEVE
jgi:hypothetical protein